jgi:hypothetical protein
MESFHLADGCLEAIASGKHEMVWIDPACPNRRCHAPVASAGGGHIDQAAL